MLEAIEAGCHRTGCHDQQPIQKGGIFLDQTLRDPGIDRRMNLRAQVIGQPIERAERRQIDRRLAQNLDRQIDQVSRIAHRRRRFRDRGRQQFLAPLVISHDIEKGPDRRSIPVKRLVAGGFNKACLRIGQAQLRCKIGDRFAVEISRGRKESEILSCLQQSSQCQTAGSTARLAADEDEIGLAQTVPVFQLLPGEALPGMRVGGAVDRCHKMSRKGFAEGVEKSAQNEGFGT